KDAFIEEQFTSRHYIWTYSNDEHHCKARQLYGKKIFKMVIHHNYIRYGFCINRGSTSNENRLWCRLRNELAIMSRRDRKSTRLNSSHVSISYAVFCLKKKNT